MSVIKRGKVWYLKFRPFGKQLQIALKSCETKRQALSVETELSYALKSKDFSTLSKTARVACVNIHNCQNWELPPELKPETSTGYRNKSLRLATVLDCLQEVRLIRQPSILIGTGCALNIWRGISKREPPSKTFGHRKFELTEQRDRMRESKLLPSTEKWVRCPGFSRF